MTDSDLLRRVWLILLALTLAGAALAESTEPSNLAVVLICVTVLVKGQLVIDRLMGLRLANRKIRWVMLSYVYLLPPLIALAVLFPTVVADLTSL